MVLFLAFSKHFTSVFFLTCESEIEMVMVHEVNHYDPQLLQNSRIIWNIHGRYELLLLRVIIIVKREKLMDTLKAKCSLQVSISYCNNAITLMHVPTW